MQLAERFGWTLTEMDAEDAARVLPSVKAANVAAAYRRVLDALKANRLDAVSDGDWEVYNIVQKALVEEEDD